MIMTFDEAWDLAIDTVVTVRTGPPPSTNTEGYPYKAWKSHNFTGTLEEKITRDGWRYLRFEVNADETPEAVEYLAHEIPEGGAHSFITQD